MGGGWVGPGPGVLRAWQSGACFRTLAVFAFFKVLEPLVPSIVGYQHGLTQ